MPFCTFIQSWAENPGRNVMADDPGNARPIVSSLLVGRVTFAPVDDGRWRLTGEGTLSGLFERVFSVGMASPTGMKDFYMLVGTALKKAA